LNAVRARIDAGQYRFLADSAGYRARSVEEGLQARFDRNGAHFSTYTEKGSDAAGNVTLRFAAWGRAGSEREVESVEPVLGACNDVDRVDEQGECVQRLELHRDGLVEWWDNTSRGLQQAWTIDAKPAGKGPLQLLVDVEGASASSEAGNSVSLRRADGSVIEYDELYIVDADGQTLEGSLRAEAGRIVISFDDGGARYPVTVDPVASLTWSPGVTPQGGAYLGLHMTGLGDVNGDGSDDFAIGAHGYHGTQLYAGKVFVWHGFKDETFNPALGPSSAPTWQKTGTREAGGLGSAVAGGDFNGDGYGDLLVSEPVYSTVYIYFGSSAGLGANPGWTATSGVLDDMFGWSVSSAGDVNGDGKADALVGAPFYGSTAALTEEGKAFLYLGGAIGSMSTSASWNRRGNQARARLGWSLAGVGDVNGDGRSDVVVGGPGYNSKGRVWGYLGAATSAGLGNAVWNPEGAAIGDAFGHSVAPAGDDYADGYPDVLVGAPGWDGSGHADAGAIYNYDSGASGFAAHPDVGFMRGTVAGRQMGLTLAGAGDLNGDNQADALLGGNPPHGGGVRYASGSHNADSSDVDASFSYAMTVAGVGDVSGDGFADALFGDPWHDDDSGTAKLAAGRPALSYDSHLKSYTDAADSFGSAVADAGDVNGDGYSDLLVGSDLANDSAVASGKAYLYHGGSVLSFLPDTANWSTSGLQANAHLGRAMVGCDFDNNGYSDVAISAPDYDFGMVDRGRVMIFTGAAGGLGPNGIPREGTQSGAQFGAALAAGDVNGDGFCDLAVGAPRYDDPGQPDEGRVFIYFGGPAVLSLNPDRMIQNNAPSSWFGSALSMGDVNLDGRKDLAVGAKNFSNGELNEGAVFVYWNLANGNPATHDWMAESHSPGASFGAALTMEADHNRGGRPDLAVGAPGFTGSLSQEGRVTLYQATSTGFSAPLHITGGWANTQLGRAVVGGDHNGDGYGDLAYAGVDLGFFLRFGNKDGLSNPSAITVRKSTFAGERDHGRSLSLRSDLNADGSSELSGGFFNNGLFLIPKGGAVKSYGLYLSGGTRLQALRPGTTVPIAPGGKSPTNAVDIRLFARTPYGRMKVKLEVQVRKCGDGFFVGGAGLVSPTWTDSGVAGTWLTRQVTSLTANTAYYYRARILYQNQLGFGATHSRWYYGGTQGHVECGAHFRTP
jgi:hypothetical protein